MADAAVLGGLVTGRERTFGQDPLFAFRLQADIGMRALPPAVNDPATAVQVLDTIEAFCRLWYHRTRTWPTWPTRPPGTSPSVTTCPGNRAQEPCTCWTWTSSAPNTVPLPRVAGIQHDY